MPLDFRVEFERRLAERQTDYTVRGVVTGAGEVFPLGTDTKVLSTIFEAFARPLVYEIAEAHDLEVWEARAQNSYPDFTLMSDRDDQAKIAVDVKTTYRDSPSDRVSFTLGSYRSFIQPGNETRGIEFPYSEYAEDWIVGYIYQRVEPTEVPAHVYSLDDIGEIPAPYEAVEVFARQKWEIAGEIAGSGNTANIGSIRGDIDHFRHGDPVFRDKQEFLAYWRGYRRTAAERATTYANLREFRRRRRG
jgi:hypothetical protein